MAKIIKTPARNLTICGVRPDGGTFFPPPVSYALNFDGVNDYLQNDASTPFTQWERTQPCTYEFFIRQNLQGTTQHIFSSLTGLGANIFGIQIAISSANKVFVYFGGGTDTNRMQVATVNSVPPAGSYFHLAVTYNGSSTPEGILVYINGVLQVTNNVAGLTSTITTGVNSIKIGRRGNDLVSFFNGIIKDASVTNYAKNQTEINADIAAGEQLAGTGAFLFRLPLIYKDNGTGNIATLDSTVPIPELAQNLDMTYFGYPNPLVLNTNLIEI